MSALCAAFDKSHSPVDLALIQKMESVLSQWGTCLSRWQGTSVVLSQATETSHSPQRWTGVETMSVYVVADAQLYYKNELKQLLQRRGCGGLGDDLSDGDLIAAAYTLWGESCVEHLEGDYSFVLWDSYNHRLFAARSPMGLRPLFFHQARSQLWLASDPGILLANPCVPRDLDPTWVTTFLTSGRYCDGTMFRDIAELPPGSTLTATRERQDIAQYWFPSPRSRVLYRNSQEYAEHFRTAVEAAVRERVSKNSPTLIEVSGGLDSSTIACFAGRASQSDSWSPTSYGIHFSSEAFAEKDERSFAKLVAEKYGIPMRYFTEAQAPILSEPLGAQSWMAGPHTALLFFDGYYQRMREYAEEVRAHVVLRGTFGDQLFLPATYRYLGTAWQERRYALLSRELLQLARTNHSLTRAMREGYLSSRRVKSGVQQVPWVRESVEHLAEEYQIHRRKQLRATCPHPFSRELYGWMGSYSEYVSLSASLARDMRLEVRDPYADLRIIELLLSFPPSVQIRQGTTKFLLREATRGILPEPVRTRTTKGRIARVILEGIYRHAGTLNPLIQNLPEVLSPYIDKEHLAHSFRNVVLGGPVHQPSLLSTLGLVVWAHRLPWAGGYFPQSMAIPLSAHEKQCQTSIYHLKGE